MWLVYGSEISACIGENKYKKRWESFLTVFKRLENGLYYATALSRLERLGYKIIDNEEKMQEIIEDTGIADSVKDLLSADIHSSEDLQHNIEAFENKVEQKAIQLKEHKKQLKNIIVQENVTLHDIESDLHHTTKQKERLQQEYVSLEESATTDPQYLEKLKTDLLHVEKVLQEKQIVKMETLTKVNELNEDLDKHDQYWSDFKNTKKNIISQKQTSFGREKEDSLIASKTLGVVTNNNVQFYKKCFGENPILWGIGGRIDGFREGVLIEIKNRKSQLFDPLPLYDVIQVQTYMQLLDVYTATVIQCLTTNENGTSSCLTKEIELPRDDLYWNNTILPELQTFISALHSFAKDTLLQDKFFQTPDIKKSYIITSLFNKVRKEMNGATKSVKPKTTKRKSPLKTEISPPLSQKPNTFSTMDDFMDDFMNQQSSSSALPLPPAPKKRKQEKKKDDGVVNDGGDQPNPVVKPFDPSQMCFFDDPNNTPRKPVDFSHSIVDDVPEDWKVLLNDQFTQDYFQQLVKFVDEEYKTFLIYPARDQIFSSLQKCSLKNVKVVILGLDPYINPGQAMGLAFSVPKGVKFPFSLKNIFNEVQADISCETPVCGDLTSWAEQGVLLLNSILTVRSGKTESHKAKGWETFTDALIRKLNQTSEHLVFLLWGKIAQEKEYLIDAKKHTVLRTSHPSPLSYNKGFKGCQHFKSTNEDLMNHGLTPIDWKCNIKI